MCGIIGIIGGEPVAPQLIDALKRLEYRGYDSAGVATLEHGSLTRRRAEGKLKNLELKLAREPLSGTIGIGHTRWATHGRPTENNAHPHATDRLAVVHNGIIENFSELRRELEGKGAKFATETDSEVVAHLVSEEIKHGLSPVEAVKAALPRLRGAFALAFLFAGEENLLIGARKGSPLAIGFGDGAMFIGSDAIALAPFTDTVSYLEDGDCAVISRTSAEIYDAKGAIVHRAVLKSLASVMLIDKGNHRHFMAKEIHEQPEVVGHTLANYLDMVAERVALPMALPFDFRALKRAVDRRLRHRVLRRHDRAVLVRTLCAFVGRCRHRLRVSLPRRAARGRRACDLHFAVGRDRRHAGVAALCARAQAARSLHRQRADLDHRPRKRGRHADACRPGNRRRLDQGLHLPAGGAGGAGDRGRPRPRRAQRERREAAGACPHRGAAAPDRGADARAADRADSPAIWRNAATCSISAAAPAIRSRWKAR